MTFDEAELWCLLWAWGAVCYVAGILVESRWPSGKEADRGTE